MANPILYTITMPNGHIYDLGDAYARELIKELLNFHEWLGITTTPIEDGDITNPILINGVEVTAVAGDVVSRSTDHEDFVMSSSGVWQSFGHLSGLGALAFKDTASGSYTPQGTISGTTLGTKSISQVTNTGTMPTFTVQGTNLVITGGTEPTIESTTVADGTVTTEGTFSGTPATITVS